MSSNLDKTIQNIDLSKYQVRFNQKNYNQMSIIKDNIVKYVLTFHFIGMIDTNKQIFIWSNIIPGVNKNFIKKITKLNLFHPIIKISLKIITKLPSKYLTKI